MLNDIGPLVPWSGLVRLKNVHAGLNAKFKDLPELERHLRDACASFGPLDDAKWRHVTRHSARRNEDGTWSLAYDPGIVSALRRGNNSGLEFGGDFLLGVDLWPVWETIRCPTLVLRGAESDLLLESTAQQMAERGPKARVVEFPGIGHAPWLMNDDQIDVVRGFLLAPLSALELQIGARPVRLVLAEPPPRERVEVHEMRVADSGRGEAVDRPPQVVEPGADRAAGVDQALDHLLRRQPAGVAGAVAVDDEGERAERARAVRDDRPPRRIRAEQHFAPPEEPQLVLRHALRDAIHDAVAAAAAVEPEHQAGALGRAAVHARPQAEAAVIAVDGGDDPLVEVEHRVPDQRAVREDPDVGLTVRRAKDRLERVLERLLGQELGGARRALERSPQDVVDQVLPAEDALLRGAPVGADERLAALDRVTGRR